MSATDIKTDTATLLGLYADLINTHGLGSPEVEDFLKEHRDNQEFTDLAQTANFLRAKLDRYYAETRQRHKHGRRRASC